MILQSVVADIINGYTKNDIIMKFANKGYEYQKKAIGEAQAKNYIKMAYLLMAEDRVQEQDKLRDQLFSQYMMLYNDAVLTGNTIIAKQVLDSMAKIFCDPAAINLKVDGKIDGNITVDFDFVEDEG